MAVSRTVRFGPDKEMIVWGGVQSTPQTVFLTGGRYNPATDSWTATTTVNAPHEVESPTAMWTGSQMIVWGGAFSFYDPSVTTFIPSVREDSIAQEHLRLRQPDHRLPPILTATANPIICSSTRYTANRYLVHEQQRLCQLGYGPTLPAGWVLVHVADFNRDGKPTICYTTRLQGKQPSDTWTTRLCRPRLRTDADQRL